MFLLFLENQKSIPEFLNINPSHAAIRITVNAAAAGFISKKKKIPTPVQIIKKHKK